MRHLKDVEVREVYLKRRAMLLACKYGPLDKKYARERERQLNNACVGCVSECVLACMYMCVSVCLLACICV